MTGYGNLDGMIGRFVAGVVYQNQQPIHHAQVLGWHFGFDGNLFLDVRLADGTFALMHIGHVQHVEA